MQITPEELDKLTSMRAQACFISVMNAMKAIEEGWEDEQGKEAIKETRLGLATAFANQLGIKEPTNPTRVDDA